LIPIKAWLTPAQIAEGMNAACSNANRLASDAALLLEARRYPSAMALAILAIEESGKKSILRRLAVATSDEEHADAWRAYRSHTSKNVLWDLPSLVAAGARKLEDFRPLFHEGAEHPYLLDMLKQIAFYTDCLGNAHWSVPSEAIDETLTQSIVQTAKLLAGSPDCTAKEMELWIEHTAPAFATKEATFLKQSLVSWYQAMHAHGLASDIIGTLHYQRQ
jgi:AbiV family abortive infection protein